MDLWQSMKQVTVVSVRVYADHAIADWMNGG